MAFFVIGGAKVAADAGVAAGIGSGLAAAVGKRLLLGAGMVATLKLANAFANIHLNKNTSHQNSKVKTNQSHDNQKTRDTSEQSRKEQQHRKSGGGQQGGGGRGDDDRGRDDRRHDHEEEESDSEEEIDDEEKQKTKKKTNSTSESVTVSRRPIARLFGLLNVRSLNNKISKIFDLIMGRGLDVLCTTETWLNEETADGVLRRASPDDFNNYHQVRASRGGGAAIQARSDMATVQVVFDSKITSFEVVATVMQHESWSEPIMVISLYRRGATGARYQEFLEEFQNILAEIFDICNNVIVTGDFNIWVDNLRRGREFRCLLQIFQLDQHVSEPTHHRGHILDLVITRNVEVTALFVRNDNISDHYTIYFNARPESVSHKKKKDEDEDVKRHKKK